MLATHPYLVIERHREWNESNGIMMPPDELPGSTRVHEDLLHIICTEPEGKGWLAVVRATLLRLAAPLSLPLAVDGID